MFENNLTTISGSNSHPKKLEGECFMHKNEELYKDIKSYIKTYLDTSNREVSLLVLYSSATHVFSKYRNFPILHITGDFETGKNRRLDLIGTICFNPSTYVNPSYPSLFRKNDEEEGTIMLDEADELIGEKVMKGFFLSGFQKGYKVTRVVADDKHDKGFRTVEFEVYGPKVIVTREGTEDEALNSRFITIVTLPLSKNSHIPYTLPEKAFEEGASLKKRIERMFKKHEIIESYDLNIGLTSRDAQVFECIKDVAYILGQDAVKDLKEFIAVDYIPESMYNTAMTLQEDLIKEIDKYWSRGEMARIATIKNKLDVISSDYRSLSNKAIARAIRSLGFKTKPDNQSTIVLPNSKLLDVLKVKYGLIQDETNSQNLNLESVGSGEESERVRPQRPSNAMERNIMSKMPRQSK